MYIYVHTCVYMYGQYIYIHIQYNINDFYKERYNTHMKSCNSILYTKTNSATQGRLKHTKGPGQKKTHGPHNNLITY